jgi:hypothetical protein
MFMQGTDVPVDNTLNWPMGAKYMSMVSDGGGISTATTGQGGAAFTGTNSVLSETFTPQTASVYGAPNNSSFTLSALAFLATGGSNGNVVSMHLFDVTSTLANGPPNSSAGNTTYSVNGLTDMFGSGAGLSFNWNPGAVAAGHAWLISIVFNSPDNVPILLNHTYALEFWLSQASGTNAFVWNRVGATPTDPGGQMMASGDASPVVSRVTISAAGLAGSAPRTAALALYGNPIVPEPLSAASAIGLGVAVAAARLLARRRL